MADFGEGASVVTDGYFPSRTAEEPRLLGGAVPLDPVVARMKHGVITGRRDQRDAVPLGRRVAPAAVVGAVANHEGDGRWLGEFQHLAKHLRVLFLARGDHACDHEGRRWIKPEMDFCGTCGAATHGRWSARCRDRGFAARWNQPRGSRRTWGRRAAAPLPAGGRARDGAGTGSVVSLARSRTERSKPTAPRSGSRYTCWNTNPRA